MRLLVLEIAFVLCALVGVGMKSLPAALVIGGVVGVLACERGSARVDSGRDR